MTGYMAHRTVTNVKLMRFFGKEEWERGVESGRFKTSCCTAVVTFDEDLYFMRLAEAERIAFNLGRR